MWPKPRLHSSPPRRKFKTFQKEQNRRPKTANDVIGPPQKYPIIRQCYEETTTTTSDTSIGTATEPKPQQVNRKLLIDNFMASGNKLKGTTIITGQQNKNFTPGRKNSYRNTSRRSSNAFSNAFSNVNTEREINTSTPGTSTPIPTAWDSFNDHVKDINDSPLMLFSSKPLNFRSSDQFKRVMDNIKPKKPKKQDIKPELNPNQNATLAIPEEKGNCQELTISEEKQPLQQQPDPIPEYETESDSDLEEDHQRNPEVCRAAQRGWALIRRYINDRKLKNRKKQTTISWSFLRHAMTNMTDMEKARDTLYEKYIYNPDTWSTGLTRIPAHIRINKADPKLVARHKQLKEIQDKKVINGPDEDLYLTRWNNMLNKQGRHGQAYSLQPVMRKKILKN